VIFELGIDRMTPGIAVRLVALASLVAIGCGGGGGGSQDGGGEFLASGDSGADECIDEDDDGFGVGCDKRDCDDADPEITTECFRCTPPGPGCPCEQGTAPIHCKPPDIKVPDGVLVCRDGTTYCRDGKWSACEVIGEYMFVAQ
jgi:hypothetical protein